MVNLAQSDNVAAKKALKVMLLEYSIKTWGLAELATEGAPVELVAMAQAELLHNTINGFLSKVSIIASDSVPTNFPTPSSN